MDSNRNLIRIILAILFLAAPALTIRFISSYYNAPHLQPLGITKENLAAVEGGKQGDGMASIDVRIGWGRDFKGKLTQEKLRQLIEETLDHQTEYYHFMFDDMPGEEIEVTFVVGGNRYGPYPPSRMIDGMTPALIALRMNNGVE